MTLGLVEVEEVCRLLLLLLLFVNTHLTINQGLLGVPIGLEIKVELLLLLFLIILLLTRLSNLRNCSLILPSPYRCWFSWRLLRVVELSVYFQQLCEILSFDLYFKYFGQ
jgi:hypothetical protein